VSIIIPVDYHATAPPSSETAAGWLAQVPAPIAAAHPPELAFVDWRHARPETEDLAVLAELAPKELRRQSISGADRRLILENVARLWSGARRCLDKRKPAAILLWNCGNADQNAWAMLARERSIPIMHVEHGWLPRTRIFDPVGGYVVGRSDWDRIDHLRVEAEAGASVIEKWRRLGLSKHAQGAEPADSVKRFCRRGGTLLVAMQLETDGASVYHRVEHESQRDFIRHCLKWPGPVLVKRHPVAARVEWEPAFAKRREHCRLEIEAKGGMWLGANENLHGLFPLVGAVAAINSNVLLEAAMAGRPAYSFGEGPHSGRGFTRDRRAGDEWGEEDAAPQTEDERTAVCEHVARMVQYLTPEGAWLPGWSSASFWGGELWADAPARLLSKWRRLLGES